MSNADARYIRDTPDGLTGRKLAKMFGVAETTIREIQCGKKYRNVGGNVRKSKCPPVPDDVRDEIRRLYKRGKHGCGAPALAKKFGVGSTTVLKIVHESSKPAKTTLTDDGIATCVAESTVNAGDVTAVYNIILGN